MEGKQVLANLVMQACRSEGWILRPGGDLAVVVVPVADGRQQEVIVGRPADAGGDQSVVRFHTVIGPVKDLTGSRPLHALRLNFGLISGAFAIHGEDVVLCRLHPIGDLDAEEARETIRYLAEKGDRYEEHLYGTDVH